MNLEVRSATQILKKTCAIILASLVMFSTRQSSKIPLSYKWIINAPKYSLKQRGNVSSPNFSTSSPLKSCNYNMSWKLSATNWREIVEVGLEDGCRQLSFTRPSQKILISECKYSIVDPVTEIPLFTKTVKDEELNLRTGLSTQKCMLIKCSELDRYILHEALTIKVSAYVTEISEKSDDLKLRPVPLDSIRKELHTLYKDEVFTDVTIKCEDKEFKVHKAILASQSPVFKKMFEIDMKESRDNLVNISDFDPAVVSEMLAYIYSGEALSKNSLAEDKDLAKRLLKAADMYQIPRLVTLCANEMQKRLTVKDVVEVLMHAHTHNFIELKTACLRFIQAHAKEVKRTDGWKVLKENAEMYSSLLVEIMEILAT